MARLAAEPAQQSDSQMAICLLNRFPFFVDWSAENPGRQLCRSAMRLAPAVLQTASGLRKG
jgi:hypothetical protein